MKFEATILALAGLSAARDIPLFSGKTKREVPQEHSHQAILDIVNTNLQLNNPLQIQDAVFALLGNAAAANGAPNVANLDCLQQIVADQAFTNAKAAGDITGQANAIMFRALERNTGKVGLESVLCNETATNPEIAAITQHQDPASAAASGNKDIALAVAQQLASIGADPNLAIQTGTFAPGNLNDATAAGNTCDDANDKVGCIISQNLLVPDVTEDEIATAVAGVNTGSSGNAASGNVAANNTAAAGSGCAAAGAQSSGAASGNAATTASGANVNAFTGSLGSAPVPVVSSAGDRPFSVNGATFVNLGAAIQRACAVQNNACSNAANSGQIDASVGDCNAQEQQCNAAGGSAKRSLRKLRIARQNVDFGSCADPSIIFADGLDGRKEASFAPNDESTFSHGSALNIKVISDFICGQLASKCDASDATVADCQAASTAAQAQKGQAAADAFNQALGV